jgi:hypothetical protein
VLEKVLDLIRAKRREEPTADRCVSGLLNSSPDEYSLTSRRLVFVRTIHLSVRAERIAEKAVAGCGCELARELLLEAGGFRFEL